jgi:hypothetical protein
MCIRCLERLYAVHGSTTASFPDVMILIHSIASTSSIETQHRLRWGCWQPFWLGAKSEDDADEEGINIPENAEQG